MRLVVTGKYGQLVTALRARASAHADIALVCLGRPELDLTDAAITHSALVAARPDVIVSAAAYTGVDRAESEPDLAFAVNRDGPAAIAGAAASLGVPLIHISTDYVFDGAKPQPYDEADPVAPLGVYGRSKLAGEEAIQLAHPDHLILRTAWLYSPFGTNFLKTMLRLAGERKVISVVADQRGAPTSALDLADIVIGSARNLLADRHDAALRGVFHAAGSGEASWAEFATEIFAQSRQLGGPGAAVEPIASAHYPTPAKRPANSRLVTFKLASTHGLILPDWHQSVADTVHALIVPATGALP